MANIVEFEARASIERQAREWLIRLDADAPLTDDEKEALRQWMDHSPSHREELQRICGFWKQANVLTELAVPLAPGIHKQHTTHGRRWRQVAIAASAVLALMLSWWGLQHWDRASNNGTYGTVIGQRQTIALLDGSSIELNTDSQVQVAYSKHWRRIHLLRGEALFAVTHDPNRAFEVYAADSVVRAVGTAFTVHLEGHEVDVTVTKGIVDLAEAGDTDSNPTRLPLPRLGRLIAGQTATLGNGSLHPVVRQLTEPELKRRMAWREGYLVFSGEPLSEVVEQMNRFSPVTLEIGDPQLASVAIGGRFGIGDLNAVLDVLRTNFDIRSHQVDERHIRLESGHR